MSKQSGFTPCVGYHHYPPYLNITVVDDDVRVNVRGSETSDGRCGNTVEVHLTLAEWTEVLKVLSDV